MDARAVGTALEVLRIARGWKQRELAAAAEVRTGSISSWERGDETPDAETARRLVAAMGFPPDALERARRFLAELRGEEGARRPEPDGALEQEAERLRAEIDAVAGGLGRLLRELARRRQ